MANVVTGVLPKLTGAFASPAIVGVLPKVTASFSAAVTRTGTVAATLPVVSASISAKLSVQGAVSGTLAEVTASLTGGMRSLSATLPAVDANVVGLAGVLGRASMQTPRMTGAFIASVSTITTVSGRLPSVSANIAALVGSTTSLAGSMRKVSANLSGLVGVRGVLAASLPSIEASINAYQSISASMALRLPSLSAALIARLTPAQVALLVCNTITNSMTKYAQYPFNSFAEINGLYYAAGPEGLYQIDIGDLDTTTAIDAHITTGQTKFYSEMQKRLSDVYIGMRSAGDLSLSVYVDERDPYSYTISPHDIDTIKQRRCPVGKGLKGKYWKFSLANTNGCDFDVDTMNMAAVPLERRL